MTGARKNLQRVSHCIHYTAKKKKKRRFDYFLMFQSSHYSFTVASQTLVYSTIVTAILDGIWEHYTTHHTTGPKYWIFLPITWCAAFTDTDKDTLKTKDWYLYGLWFSKVNTANKQCSALWKILFVMVAVSSKKHSSALTNVFSIQQLKRRLHLRHIVFIAMSSDEERSHHMVFQIFSPCRCASASTARPHLGRTLGLIHVCLWPRSPGMNNCYCFSLDC